MDNYTSLTISSVTTNNMKRKTVKFNVGGKIFEVSRSILDSFPDTMLSKAASEIWTKENNDDDPIFIERNYDRFPYVLDYMRDGYISLPGSITKDVMVNELSYFCFDTFDIEKITVQYSPALAGISDQNKLEIINDMRMELKFMKLTFMCFAHYIKTASCIVHEYLYAEEGEEYGLFRMYDTLEECQESTGPSIKYEQNVILKRCAARVGIRYISAYNTLPENPHSSFITWYIKFGFMNEWNET